MFSSKSIRVLIVVTAFAILSGATFYMPNSRAREAKDKDNDDEAQAAKDLADREKKLAEEKARKAAEVEAAAVAAAEAKKKEAEKAKPAVKVVPVMPTRCPLCQDMKILPNLPYRNYIRFENEPPPNPDHFPPWHICDKCQKGIDAKAAAKEISDDMKTRQDNARAQHKPLEDMLTKKFVQFETPYITVRSMLAANINHKIADGLEKCAGILETNSKSMVLMGTRPDKDQIVIVGDEPTYFKLVDQIVKDPKENLMSRKLAGMGWYTSDGAATKVIDNGKPGMRQECFAVFDFGGMLMHRATDGKAKPWLTEGFSAYCENATFGTNTVVSIAYEENNGIKFDKNWNEAFKKVQKENKVKLWEEIYEIQLEHLKQSEYLHFYSMVSFLIKQDPARFDKFVLLIKEGMESGPAIVLAYGKPSKEIQIMWRNWIPTQK